jgi:hypothetical protein
MRELTDLPHPAILSNGAQLDRVIAWLELGALPQPGQPVWRPDVPREQAVRLAVATGADRADLASVLASLDSSQGMT